MLEGLNAIHKRISEIEKQFAKLNGPQKMPDESTGKDFQSYMKESESSVSAAASSKSSERFVVKSPVELSTQQTPPVEKSAEGAYNVYGKRHAEEKAANAEKAKEERYIQSLKNSSLPFSSRRELYNSIIEESAKKHGIEKELLKALVHQESSFTENARSPKGALGLAQLMPSTAKSLGVDMDNILSPKENVGAGAKYLSMLLDKYKGDKELALAAYNAGTRSVDEAGGIPPYEETQNYVKKVLGYYSNYLSE